MRPVEIPELEQERRNFVLKQTTCGLLPETQSGLSRTQLGVATAETEMGAGVHNPSLSLILVEIPAVLHVLHILRWRRMVLSVFCGVIFIIFIPLDLV